MRINRLIEQLQQIQKTHGDVEVWVMNETSADSDPYNELILDVRSEANEAVIVV